jgi:hypothetical protein
MNTHTDNAVNGAEQDVKGEKTRGPRAKYFFCAAFKNKDRKNILEPIEAATADEASKNFETKHGFAPDLVDGGQSLSEVGGGAGYYLAKGTGMAEARASITVTAEQMSRNTTTHFRAEYKGWVVYGNGLKGCMVGSTTYKDDELAWVLFEKLVDSDSKLPKPKLKKTEAIPMSELKIISKST